MKRVGNLWPQVIDIDNLYAAARQAQQGKRFKSSVLAFNHCLEDELYQLHEGLFLATEKFWSLRLKIFQCKAFRGYLLET